MEQHKMSSIKEYLETYFGHFEQGLKDEIVKNGRLRTFAEGIQVIGSGELMKYTMLVIKGRLKLYTDGVNGEEFFMYYLEPGQACALSFVCAARNRKSDLEAFAVEETEVIMIPIGLMAELMVKYKSWYIFVIETYRSRYKELLDAIRSVAFHAMDERLEYYLIKQKNTFGSTTLSLKHEQIANDLNSSRVVISRLLKQLELKGKVKLLRNAIELKF
jgi:CRP/FNR family transcriptional regulator